MDYEENKKYSKIDNWIKIGNQQNVCDVIDITKTQNTLKKKSIKQNIADIKEQFTEKVRQKILLERDLKTILDKLNYLKNKYKIININK